MKPTVGRIVHYHQAGYEEPLAAIITKVWTDHTVNLTVFYPDGATTARSSVSLVENDVPSWGFWSWPPRAPGAI